MRASLILSMLAALTLLGACSERTTPTVPFEDGPPTPLADHQGGWELLFRFFTQEANGFMACLNGGEGEESWWAGTSSFYAKQTATPSGSVNFNMKVELEDDVRIIGWGTGDIWTLEGNVSHFAQHIRRQNGHLYTVQADNEWFVNQRTGERIKVLWIWDIEWDENFNRVRDDSRLVQCARLGT